MITKFQDNLTDTILLLRYLKVVRPARSYISSSFSVTISKS